MAYRIEFAPRAQREFKALDGLMQARIALRLDSLARNPNLRGIQKIEGEAEFYRVFVAEFRILCQVKRQARLVLILGIGHRREVYRRIGG